MLAGWANPGSVWQDRGLPRPAVVCPPSVHTLDFNLPTSSAGGIPLPLCPEEDDTSDHGLAMLVTLSPCSALDVTLTGSTSDIAPPSYSSPCSTDNVPLPPCHTEDIAPTPCFVPYVAPLSCYAKSITPSSCLLENVSAPSGPTVDVSSLFGFVEVVALWYIYNPLVPPWTLPRSLASWCPLRCTQALPWMSQQG